MAEAAAAGTSGQSSSNSVGQQSQAQGSAAQGGASQGEQSQQQTNSGEQQAAPSRPDWLPESFWDTTKNEIKGGDFRKSFDDLSAFKAEQDIRANTLPKSEADYQVKLPDDFKAPEGLQFELDPKDPLWANAKKTAFESKVDQDTFSKFAGIYAATKIAEVQKFETAKTAELGKLGTAAPQRIEAVCTWLNARGGPDAQLMINSLKQYPVAANVAMFETIIKGASSQGGGAFSQQHREGAPETNKIPGYEKMSFEQRRGAQLSLPQNQRAAAGR